MSILRPSVEVINQFKPVIYIVVFLSNFDSLQLFDGKQHI